MREVTLTAAERDAISGWNAMAQQLVPEILGKYPDRRSAIMPLLYVSMVEDGRVTAEGMKAVGVLTGLTGAQVQSVASFYSIYKREELGQYLVSVCTSISCFLQGADDVLAAIEDEAGVPDGETGGDGRFTVEHIECNGACAGATVVLVNYEMVEGVTPDKARELIKWLRDGGPDVVSGDEMQQLFGGNRSFDWAIKEPEGAYLPIPAFGPYGSAKGVE